VLEKLNIEFARFLLKSTANFSWFCKFFGF